MRTEFWMGEHHFRLNNLFSLSLCAICRLPLWGATSQAYRCSGPCSLMAHPQCLASGGGRLGRCRGTKPGVEMFKIEEEKLRNSFVAEYASLIGSDGLLASSHSRPSFEEVAVASAILRLQLELFEKGVANGTLVLDLAKSGEPYRFELHEAVERLRISLEGGELEQSKTLSELIDLERTDSTILTGTALAERLVFSRSFLSLLVLTLKSPKPPSSSSPTVASGSGLLHVAAAESPSSDEFPPFSPHPFDTVPLSHLFSRLSSTLSITSPTTSFLFLSHLHTLGAFQRQEGQAVLFPLGPLPFLSTPPPKDVLCSFVLPQGVDNAPVQVDLLVSAIEACLSDLNVSVNEVGLMLASRLCMPSGSSQSWVMDRLAGAIIKWMLEEVRTTAFPSICFRVRRLTRRVRFEGGPLDHRHTRLLLTLEVHPWSRGHHRWRRR